MEISNEIHGESQKSSVVGASDLPDQESTYSEDSLGIVPPKDAQGEQTLDDQQKE